MSLSSVSFLKIPINYGGWISIQAQLVRYITVEPGQLRGTTSYS